MLRFSAALAALAIGLWGCSSSHTTADFTPTEAVATGNTTAQDLALCKLAFRETNPEGLVALAKNVGFVEDCMVAQGYRAH